MTRRAILAFALLTGPIAGQDEPDPADTLARSFAARIEAGDARTLRPMFDLDELLDRTLEPLELPESRRPAVRAFRTGFKRSSQFLSGILVAAKGGRFGYRRNVMRDDEKRALFRLIQDNGGVNYFEFVCSDDDGKARFTDCYVYSTGELVSETVRRLFVLTERGQQKGLFAKLFGKGSDVATARPQIQRLARAVQTSEWAVALQAFDALPESLRREKFAQIARLQALGSIDDDAAYLAGLDEFAKLLGPDDPACALMLIDAYYMRAEYDVVVDMVTKLRDRVGGDGWLRTLQASAMIEAKEYTRAREFAELAVAEEASLFEAHSSRIATALLENNDAATLRALQDAAEEWELDASWLAGLEGWKRFLTTPEGARWTGKHPR